MLLSYIKDEASECLSNYQDFLCAQGEFESFVISLKKNHQSFWEKSNIINSLSFKEPFEEVINNSFLNYSKVKEEDEEMKKFISDLANLPYPNSNNKEKNIFNNIPKVKNNLKCSNKANFDNAPLLMCAKKRISKRKAKYKRRLLGNKESQIFYKLGDCKKTSKEKKKKKIVHIFFILNLNLTGHYYICSFIMIKKSFIVIKNIKKKRSFEADKKREKKRLKYRYFINLRKNLIQYYFFRNIFNYFLSKFYQKIINENLFNSVDMTKQNYLSNFMKYKHSNELCKCNQLVKKTKNNSKYIIKIYIFIKFNSYIII